MSLFSTPAAIYTPSVLPLHTRLLRRLLTSPLIVVLGLAVHGGAEALAQEGTPGYSVTLAWDAVPGETIVGYRVYYGVASRTYTESVEAGPEPTATVSGLTAGVTYYFAVTAFDVMGQESDFSEEITVIPGEHRLRIDVGVSGETVLRLQGIAGQRYDIEATADLKRWTVIGTVTVGEDGSAEFVDPEAAEFPSRFYRSRRAP